MGGSVSHEIFMGMAIEQGRKALEQGELPIGAVLVSDGQVVAQAHTSEKAARRRLVHAELLALDIADRITPFPGRRRDSVLYTTLEPCMMCMGACICFGVAEVHYALETATDGAGILINHYGGYFRKPKIVAGMLRAQSIDLFRIYCSSQPDGPMRDWAEALIGE